VAEPDVVGAGSTSGQPEELASEALDVLRISDAFYQEMIDHLRSTLPLEGCGIIAMQDGDAAALFPGTNTESSETRYNMDLTEIVEAFDAIDRNGWKLGALFHSHPHSAPIPSETDLANAFYPDALMVIVSFSSEPPETRAYRVDGTVREVPVQVVTE
jgi:proteasome lid subunit RPN8/RPN11